MLLMRHRRFALFPYNPPMGATASPDPQRPFLGIHAVDILVRDQEQSLRFYVDQLGFDIAFDARLPSGDRWVARDGIFSAPLGFDQDNREIEAPRRGAAEKLEAAQRPVHELEIAKQVQARLFPQTLPPLETLDYAGACIQARQVGGDYHDFLNLGQERLGLVIGDISGKGIAAALLMANLQANLRSQCTIALDQPQLLLRSVNQLFYENTSDGAYATLFFAEYDDELRRLRYVNCGHLSALLLRSDNTLERLHSTCTVLGLSKERTCSITETRLFS